MLSLILVDITIRLRSMSSREIYTASLVAVMGLATGKKNSWICTAVEAKSEVRDKAVEICRQLQNNEQEEKKNPLKVFS